MKNQQKTKKPIMAYLAGISAAIIWGGSMAVVKDASNKLDILEVMSVRLLIAAALMTLLVVLKIIKVKYSKKDILPLIGIGTLQPCMYGALEMLGIELTTASVASIFLALVPVMALILAVVIMKENVTAIQIASVVLSFGGVIIVAIFSGNFELGGKLLGYAVLLAAVSTGAAYSVCVAKVSNRCSPFEITYAMSIVGFIVYNSLNFAIGSGVDTYIKVFSEPKFLMPVLYLGVLSAVWGFLAYNYTLSKLPIHIASAMVLTGTTVIGVISGVVLLSEPLTSGTVIGTLCMVVGIIGVNKVTKKE